MAIYRKKPVEIEAIQLTAESFNDVERFLGYTSERRAYYHEGDFMRKENAYGIHIKTLEGDMLARVGDFVIKGVNGEFYPCKPDIFEKTYDKCQ